MSHLSAALTVLMTEHGYSGRELARKTGLLQTFISRIKLGQQSFIAKQDLTKIATVFLRNDKTGEATPYDAAQLIRAHLMDEKVGPGSDLVDVVVKHKKTGEEVEAKVKLSPEAERAWNYVRDRVASDQNAENFLVEFAKMLGYVPKKYKE